MSKYYFCADVGGTVIKGGIVDENNNILFSDSISSSSIKENGDLTELIEKLFETMETTSNLLVKNSSGIGIGLPGLVDNKKGIIKNLPNLKISEYDILKKLQKKYTVEIKLGNDAELATLAEHKFGSGKGFKNILMLTLGTGVGCGIILNSNSLREFSPFACEFGHNFMDISCNKCLDDLVSTRALIEQTKQAMIQNKNSKLWDKFQLETIDGASVFELAENDEIAKTVLENYIKNLGLNIVNLYNIFVPEIIIIGGGISKQGKKLTKPLEDFVNKNIFLKSIKQKVKIVPAQFCNNAGILGAKSLFS